MSEKSRVNIYMPKELKDYLVCEGEKMGFNLTTMIQIACMEYKKTQEGMALGELLKKLSDKQLSEVISYAEERSYLEIKDSLNSECK